jgi:hypothetical protein
MIMAMEEAGRGLPSLIPTQRKKHKEQASLCMQE